ncbi:MAG TPA: peptide deformylase [Terriglobia bacterium]|nr:peptide deformylase [Terriglobia bacterium]
MIHPIVKFGHAVLSKVASPVTVFDNELEKLVEEMFETMYAAHGVGLAAPQIAISKHLCVIDTSVSEQPGAKLVLANPVIVSVEGRQVHEEGCLSLPDFRADTPRPLRATVRAQDVHGREFTLAGEGLLARAFCHETDHLNGVLFIHHLSALKRESMKRKIKRLQNAGEW